LAFLWVSSAWEVVSVSVVNSDCTVTVLLSGGSRGWEKDPVGEFKLTKLGDFVVMKHPVSGATLGYFTGKPHALVSG
jgi:hypothetical protein